MASKKSCQEKYIQNALKSGQNGMQNPKHDSVSRAEYLDGTVSSPETRTFFYNLLQRRQISIIL
jgi:hypothetical protein